MYGHTYVCIYAHVYTYMCVYIYMYMCIYIHNYTYTYVYANFWYKNICSTALELFHIIYMYVYIYTYIYICWLLIHTYMYMQHSSSAFQLAHSVARVFWEYRCSDTSLQHVAACCTWLRPASSQRRIDGLRMWNVYISCSLQCVAVYCSVLQRVAPDWDPHLHDAVSPASECGMCTWHTPRKTSPQVSIAAK